MFCNVFLLFAQQKGKKITFQAEWQFHDDNFNPDVDRLIGNVIFTHEKTIGYADSAYYYINDNKITAFGKPVKILVNDSVTLYGNRAMYDGNSKLSNISNDVILKDNTTTLYTDSLIYNTNEGIGFYVTGGIMISNEDTLISKIGKYNTHTNIAHFREDVILTNPTYKMTCDSFKYDTSTEIVYFLCRTHLISDENNIYTNSGWFDTHNNFSLLIDSVKITHEDQELTADSIYYDKNLGFGIAKSNVMLIDTTRGIIVKGEYGEYLENGGLSWLTDSALLILIDNNNKDSLFLHADTLKIFFDTVQNPQLLLAYFHVKFFSNELQGACDSISYNVIDSVGLMFFNPVVWNSNNQFFGDTIRYTAIDSVNSRIELLKNAFIISDVYDEIEFNQVRGKNIIGFFYEKELKQVDIIHNVELIYYVMDEDSLLIGINRMETNEMRVFLKNNEIEELRFYDYPDGKFWAEKELPMNDRKLKDFRWLVVYRPKEIADIFVNPIPRKQEEKNEE
jgi:lipopolysaccharide export system protein LptA